MSAGHTPGPWHVVPYGDGDSLVVCYGDGPDWRICFLATPGDSLSSWCRIQADARLIAAAPELLDALERLHRNFNLLLSGKPVRDVAETDAEVRAAIAKAAGAQPCP